jgi:hypothetical protein
MTKRVAEYDIEQIMYSFQRYRSDHIFDKDSFKQQFEKHFNPELAKKVGEKVFEKREIQRTIKDNRESLEARGKLPKWDYSNKELREAKRIPTEWGIGYIKGRRVRVREVTIKIKGKERKRLIDSFGRFAKASESSQL